LNGSNLSIKKVLAIAIVILLAAILAVNVTSIVRRVVFKEQLPLTLGFGTAVVMTGSMEPEISRGDIVVVRRAQSYDVGDVITYTSMTAVTHRIVAQSTQGFVTKGDANNTVDPEIAKDQVLGRVVFTIPLVGHPILFFRQPVGIAVLILGIVAAIEVPIRLRKRPRSLCYEMEAAR